MKNMSKVPDLVEIGHWDSTLIYGVGEKHKSKTGYPKSEFYLIQSISMAVQGEMLQP